jgi:hypothetical protein
MSSEIWLTTSEASNLIQTRLQTTPGRSEAILRAARASGEVRKLPGPVLLLADDGLVGMDLGTRKVGIDVDGKPVVHNLRPDVDRISELDLLDWLDRTHPAPKKESRRGRPPAQDWDAIRRETFALMDHHGSFSPDDPAWNAQARLEAALTDKFDVVLSTLRDHLPKFLEDWKKTKDGK